MLLVFWRNPFFKTIIFLFAFLNSLKSVFPEPSKTSLGLIGELQSLVKSQRKDYIKKVQILSSQINNQQSINQNNFKELQLDPDFLKNIFIHTDSKWLQYLLQGECSFLRLLENNLIRNGKGSVEKITLITKEKKSLLISKKDYVDLSLKFKCFNDRQIQTFFSQKDIKSILKGIKFSIPQSRKECHQVFKHWQANSYLPYLCKIPETIRRGRQAELFLKNSGTSNSHWSHRQIIRDYHRYQKNIDFSTHNYLKNLCQNVGKRDQFCRSYLSQDIWSKILSGDMPKEKLSYKCNDLGFSQLSLCASQLNKSPEICTTQTSHQFPSLFPRPNCQIIKTALGASSLKAFYHDCPAQISNSSITNIHRIVNHFKKRKVSSTPLTCFSEAYYTLSLLNSHSNGNEKWPLKICYFDKIENREICKSYIPGSLEDKTIKSTEELLISSLLKRIHGIDHPLHCRFINEKKYNPNILKYKNGCFILWSRKRCPDLSCSRKIILDGKLITDFKYKSKLNWPYIPLNYSQKKFSLIHQIGDIYKLNFLKIKNFTDLEIFLKKNKNSIAHGVGCSENLLPQFFKAKYLNQCTPLPFIVDGIMKKDKNKFAILRTSINDLHSPQFVPWSHIFASLKHYENLHPLNAWTLYGLKK